MVRQLAPAAVGFGERVRKLRTRLGLDLAAFAKRVGLSYQTCRKWEMSSSMPGADSLMTVVQALAVPDWQSLFFWLAGGSSPPAWLDGEGEVPTAESGGAVPAVDYSDPFGKVRQATNLCHVAESVRGFGDSRAEFEMREAMLSLLGRTEKPKEIRADIPWRVCEELGNTSYRLLRAGQEHFAGILLDAFARIILAPVEEKKPRPR